MGWFFSDDNKFTSKEDGVKLSEDRSNPNDTRFLKVDEVNPGYHDTYIAHQDSNGRYVEGYHGGNETAEEKKDFGNTFDDYYKGR